MMSINPLAGCASEGTHMRCHTINSSPGLHGIDGCWVLLAVLLDGLVACRLDAALLIRLVRCLWAEVTMLHSKATAAEICCCLRWSPAGSLISQVKQDVLWQKQWIPYIQFHHLPFLGMGHAYAQLLTVCFVCLPGMKTVQFIGSW